MGSPLSSPRRFTDRPQPPGPDPDCSPLTLAVLAGAVALGGFFPLLASRGDAAGPSPGPPPGVVELRHPADTARARVAPDDLPASLSPELRGTMADVLNGTYVPPGVPPGTPDALWPAYLALRVPPDPGLAHADRWGDTGTNPPP